MITVPFAHLEGVDLRAGVVYEGGDSGNLSDDPLAKLLKGGNSGSFRYCGSVNNLNYLIIIFSDNRRWEDDPDPGSGSIICYGGNKFPGSIHLPPKNGNLILKKLFSSLHSTKDPRCHIPPVFLFEKYPNKASPRSVRFLGLGAPGSPDMQPPDHLGREQRQLESKRFWNCRAAFTLLDIPVIQRAWIEDLEAGRIDSPHGPIVWKMWQKTGFYRRRQAGHQFKIRSAEIQLPADDHRRAMLFKLYRYFSSSPYKFLHFAAHVYSLSNSNVVPERTRRHSSDGAYTITGKFRLGVEADPVHLEFLLEAKCYNPGIGARKRKSVGTKEIAKLISRLDQRQFGVLVTTSVVARRAYEDVRKGNHPVVCITGADIIDLLILNNVKTVRQLTEWLSERYPFVKPPE